MRHGGLWTVLRAVLWLIVGIGGLVQERAALAQEWTLPDSRQGIRTAPLPLLSRPDVQAELRLDQSQVLGAHNTMNELTRRALALRGKTGAAVIAERRAIDEAQLDWLSKYLTGNQLERLRQIELQWEGAAAMLSRPTIADHLRLTPDQRQALARVISERNAARAKLAAGPGNESAFNQKAQSVLSKTQQELWVSLLGTPVRFSTATGPLRTRDDQTEQAGFSREQR